MTTTTTKGTQGTSSLEEMVGRLVDALRWEPARPQGLGLAHAIREARRLWKSGEFDGALASLANADTARATDAEACWAHSEWVDLVQRKFGDAGVLVYSPGTCRAAALIPKADDALEVVAVLGMGWQSGKPVSRRSLRGLRSLTKA